MADEYDFGKGDHVIINGNMDGRLECHICGEHYTPSLPAPIDIYLATLAAFGKKHERCKEDNNATSEQCGGIDSAKSAGD